MLLENILKDMNKNGWDITITCTAGEDGSFNPEVCIEKTWFDSNFNATKMVGPVYPDGDTLEEMLDEAMGYAMDFDVVRAESEEIIANRPEKLVPRKYKPRKTL